MGRLLSIVSVLLVSVLSACGGSDIVCPGHLDPIAPPTMQIESLDGSNSIATAEVVHGPCSVVPGVSIDAAPGRRAVTIERRAVLVVADHGDQCLIKVVSVDGRTASVTATVAWYVNPSTAYHCSDNSNCCPQAGVVPYTLQRWEFTQKAIEVSFADASYDAGAVDGGVLDGAID